MNKLETSSNYRELAEKMAEWGMAQVELPCGEGDTTWIYIGRLGHEKPGLTDEAVKAMVEDSIDKNIDALDGEEWTHLGEMPEARIAKLQRARICLPPVSV